MMFYVTPHQVEKFSEWDSEHVAAKHPPGPDGLRYEGAIGGRVTWMFTRTSLGIVTKVKCACGATLDLTEYESW